MNCHDWKPLLVLIRPAFAGHLLKKVYTEYVYGIQ